MRTFLIELDNRPDGITNQSINSYSTPAITMAQFYSRCAVVVASTSFVSVFLMVIDEQGNMLERKYIITQYTPPEPEPEEEGNEGDGE